MMFPVKDGILYLDCPNVSVATVTTVTVKCGIEMENFMFSQKKNTIPSHFSHLCCHEVCVYLCDLDLEFLSLSFLYSAVSSWRIQYIG